MGGPFYPSALGTVHGVDHTATLRFRAKKTIIEQLKQKTSGLFSGEADRGVSPVIGVILMVALTVILAAVIGTFVLGLGDGINP